LGRIIALQYLFEEQKCAEGLSLIEHFLPWIYQIMLAYQELETSENDPFAPKTNKFSKPYYTKKVN